MFETVKVVNGYEIKRMVGTRGHYTLTIKEDDGKGWRKSLNFKTIKAAVKFIEEVLS